MLGADVERVERRVRAVPSLGTVVRRHSHIRVGAVVKDAAPVTSTARPIERRQHPPRREARVSPDALVVVPDGDIVLPRDPLEGTRDEGAGCRRRPQRHVLVVGGRDAGETCEVQHALVLRLRQQQGTAVTALAEAEQKYNTI